MADRGHDFPAFIVVDDKGNDFFDLVNKPYTGIPVEGQLTPRVSPQLCPLEDRH